MIFECYLKGPGGAFSSEIITGNFPHALLVPLHTKELSSFKSSSRKQENGGALRVASAPTLLSVSPTKRHITDVFKGRKITNVHVSSSHEKSNLPKSRLHLFQTSLSGLSAASLLLISSSARPLVLSLIPATSHRISSPSPGWYLPCADVQSRPRKPTSGWRRHRNQGMAE